jgi:molybdate transport system substrate-binding protein
MPALHLISSMATQALLADLVDRSRARGLPEARLEAVGGVDAARRVEAGEAFEIVVLSDATLRRLEGAGHLRAGSLVPLVRSGMAVAVRAGAPAPDISSTAALREALCAARAVGVSTGPSGVHLIGLFERWGLAGTLAGRLIQARPGVPVGRLIASGEVDIGFQQLSELMHLPGVQVLGPPPGEAQQVTTFSAGLAATARQPEAGARLLAAWASPELAALKQAHGMAPA